MSGFGHGVQRGAMAADHFTQISNALFRDPRLSFKAKGIFGLISTHRDGWCITVSELARRGREGREAVASGLKELEQHGYLTRERARRPDGTLADAVYAITDMPAHLYDLLDTPTAEPRRTPRSEPKTGYPAQAEPAQAEPATKNTRLKKTNKQKTNKQKTNPHPSVRTARPRETETGRTDGNALGIQVLLAIGARRPELLLTGQALHDQGQVVTEMLRDGWTLEQLEHIITGWPLPEPVLTSVGAIIAARLCTARTTPPPASAPAREHPAPRAEWTAADRTVAEALTLRVLPECAGCGHPGPAPDSNLCPACLDWPFCRTCTGPSRRRAHPEGTGHCLTCASHQAAA
ncbi:hypothetical protein G6045_28240 [Streptomyces sp. YC504]|uniref:Helix-turn-helix domain-containing protein n=1 Tax=Streptomyces mesophilus TaxID=1775132 RepID=A0A6G4XQM5_9ACTN|nr:hypothetical protein [Streptomyces mesophilus]NGO79513.1 hypothetical protein [Streptomyces mesophilus]